jgi:aryl-alcohol dehydrogenase-like predicted oxidoreductase
MSKKISRKSFLEKTSTALVSLATTVSAPSVLLNMKKLSATNTPTYRILGKTGFKVSTVGFGATRTMEPAIFQTALDSGVNFVDTGRNYFNGQNEVMVGKVVKGIRDKVIIQSKVRVKLREKGEEMKSSRVSQKITTLMNRSLEESLAALNTDYLDVLLLHGADSTDLINHEAILNFFTKAKESGKIRACGFSSHLYQATLLKSVNETKFYDVLMLAYNHKGSFIHSKYGHYREWDQPAMEEQMKIAEKNGIGIVAMKTCSAGKYSPDNSIAPSLSQALRWVINHSYIQTMAVAMGNIDEVKEDVQVMA